MIKIGSIWETVDRRFSVTGVIQKDGHTWIHYKNIRTGQEYSCYEESFVTRFREVVNDSYRKI